MTGWRTNRVLGLAAVATVLAMLMPWPASALAAEGQGRWIKVEITEGGKETPTVKVNLPLSLVEGMLDAIEVSDPDEDVTISKGVVVAEGHRVDLRKMIDELKKLPPTEFVTIEDGDTRVKVWIE